MVAARAPVPAVGEETYAALVARSLQSVMTLAVDVTAGRLAKVARTSNARFMGPPVMRGEATIRRSRENRLPTRQSHRHDTQARVGARLRHGPRHGRGAPGPAESKPGDRRGNQPGTRGRGARGP